MINKIKKEHCIYIAGLFDGEGCITLTKISRIRERCKTPTYILRCRIRMVDVPTIQWLYGIIGGQFYKRRDYKKYKNWRPYAEWGIAGKDAIDFLKQIYPYMRTKKLQAEVAFKFGETIVVGIRNVKLSQDIIDSRQKIRDEMLILNKRGV